MWLLRLMLGLGQVLCQVLAVALLQRLLRCLRMQSNVRACQSKKGICECAR